MKLLFSIIMIMLLSLTFVSATLNYINDTGGLGWWGTSVCPDLDSGNSKVLDVWQDVVYNSTNKDKVSSDNGDFVQGTLGNTYGAGVDCCGFAENTAGVCSTYGISDCNYYLQYNSGTGVWSKCQWISPGMCVPYLPCKTYSAHVFQFNISETNLIGLSYSIKAGKSSYAPGTDYMWSYSYDPMAISGQRTTLLQTNNCASDTCDFSSAISDLTEPNNNLLYLMIVGDVQGGNNYNQRTYFAQANAIYQSNCWTFSNNRYIIPPNCRINISPSGVLS